MTRLNRAVVALALASAFAVTASAAFAQAPTQAPAATQTKWQTPFRGDIELQMLKPEVKVDKDQVITTLKVKNMMNAPIAGLKIEEFWYDKAGNTIPGGGHVLIRRLIQAGEVVTVTLQSAKEKTVSNSRYQFGHANGKVKKVTQVKAF